MQIFKKHLLSLSKDIVAVYWTLIKIMVPTLILVKGLELIGAVDWLAHLLSPLMKFVGLPDAMGLVWAASILTNIYTSMAVYFELAADNPLSIAQVSVLGLLLLIGHAIPIEGAIAKKAGVRWRVTLLIKLFGSLVLGAILNATYSITNWLQEPAVMLWKPDQQSTSLIDWAYGQLELLFIIFFIITALLSLLKVLNLLGIERVIHRLLEPALRFIGVGKEAANTTVIGVTLGLSFGGGLLIQEAKAGHMKKKDVFLSMCFLALCHSLIEDTLLMMMLGAHLSAILWARLVFSLLAIAWLARWVRRPSGQRLLNWGMKSVGS